MSERARPATLDDLKQVLAALQSENAEYLLIGGYALIAHGFARATVDIDLLVPARRAAAEPIRRALLVLPDKAAAAVASEWFEDGEGIRVGDDIVVDLVFRTCGETYDSLKPFEEVFEIDGVQVRTVSLEGLLRTKQSARGQDVTDRMAIERALAAAKTGKDRK